MMRKHVVGAVFRRNFVSYFSSPTGYVFITVFIGLCAAFAFWNPRFFVENLANLDTLNDPWFPRILLFIIPAITMSLWAEERRQGTDELLMTLPANDLELVIGKYLSALGIYSVALGFGFSFVIVLEVLGDPDWGVMAGNYLAFWLLGALLISVGMVGSLLTSSMTVAFILGAVLCGGMVLGVQDYFTEMATGVVPLESVLYFVALTAVMLYTNLVLVGRRHIRRPEQGVHLSIRAVCLLVAAVSLMTLGATLGWRTDLSSARLHSLSEATKKIIDNVKADRPVYIHAYVSPEVPKSYVETQRTLKSLLRQFEARGRGRIFLNLVDTERYTQAAREADERFSIRAQQIQYVEGDQPDSEGVFLGVAFTCGAEETVIPFMARGLSVEYELTRSLSVVTGQERKKVGIATTDAKMFGGFDFQAMRSDRPWSIVEELRKQYDVSEVSLDQPVTGDLDVLVVGLPSSLTQPQMDNLTAWIKAGHPVLLLDDPFPAFNGSLAPTEPRRNQRQQNPFAPPPPPADPKGDIAGLMKTLGIQWNTEELAWDAWNPHPRYKDIPMEFIFTGPGGGNPRAFNPDQPVTSGLQEMIFLFPGRIKAAPDTSLTFTPLVQTTVQSGVNSIRNCYQTGFLGQKQFRPPTRHDPEGAVQTLAAHVSGTLPGADGKPGPAISVVFVPDIDFVHEQFFGIRAEGFLDFDNITFILNCVDALAGDEGLIEVRKRRREHRTLTRVEALTKEHKDRELEENKKAEEEAKKKLDEAQKRLDDAVKEIRESDQWDEQTKQKMIKARENVENRRLEVDKKIIEDEKAARIERSKTETEMAIKRIRDGIKWATLLLPPIPALVLAIIIFVRQKSREGRVV